MANVALLANIFFIMGVLASLGAVLTFRYRRYRPNLGMAVDANVIIFERIREELRASKGIKLAVRDGYKNAMSAIIDGNVTTILTGSSCIFLVLALSEVLQLPWLSVSSPLSLQPSSLPG